MRMTDEERRRVAGRLREYARLDLSGTDPFWYAQKAMFLPEDAGPGKAIPFREAGDALRRLADLIDPEGGDGDGR